MPAMMMRMTRVFDGGNMGAQQQSGHDVVHTHSRVTFTNTEMFNIASVICQLRTCQFCGI